MASKVQSSAQKKFNNIAARCVATALGVLGIDLVQTRQRKWYRRAVGEESTESRKTA
jgi:hypothetical protein